MAVNARILFENLQPHPLHSNMSEPITDVSLRKNENVPLLNLGSGYLQCQSHRRALCSGLENSKLSERRGAGADRGTIELFKELTQLKILLHSACSQLDDFCAGGVFWCAFFFFFKSLYILWRLAVISNWYSPQIHSQSRTAATPCGTVLR